MLAIFPLVAFALHIDGCEEGDVLTKQIRHYVITQTTVRHVDHGGGTYAVDVCTSNELLRIVYVIHHEVLSLQLCHQLKGLSHDASDNDTRGILFEKTIFLEKRLIFAHRIKTEFFGIGIFRIKMVEQARRMLTRCFCFRSEQYLFIDMLAHITEKVAIVFSSSIVHIGYDARCRGSIERTNVVGWVGHRECHDRKSLLCQFLHLSTLGFCDFQTHGVNENEIIFADVFNVFGIYVFETDEDIVIGFGNMTRSEGLEVDQSDTCGAQPCAPREGCHKD